MTGESYLIFYRRQLNLPKRVNTNVNHKLKEKQILELPAHRLILFTLAAWSKFKVVYNTLNICIDGPFMEFLNQFKVVLSLSQVTAQICSDFFMSFNCLSCYSSYLTSGQIQIRYNVSLTGVDHVY